MRAHRDRGRVNRQVDRPHFFLYSNGVMAEQAPKNSDAADAEREREERRRHEEWKQRIDWEHRSGIERIGLLMSYAAGKYQEGRAAEEGNRAAGAEKSPAVAPVANPEAISEKIQKDPLLKWLWNFRQKRIQKEKSGGFAAGERVKLAGALGGLALWPLAWSVGQALKYLVIFDFGKNESDIGHIEGDASRAIQSAYAYALGQRAR